MSNIRPTKLFRTLFQTKELSLKIHVSLYNDNYGGFNKEYPYGNKCSAKVEPGSFLTLEIRKENQVFDPSSSIFIGRGNLHMYKKLFNKVLKNIYSEAIFANKGNEVIIYNDMAEKFSDKLIVPRLNTALLIKPAVVYDENEVSYEGVNIYLNKTENVTSLYIDEFEELVNALNDVDLFLYSQVLLNYYITYYNVNRDNDIDVVQPQQQQPVRKNYINWEPQEPKTVSNFAKPNKEDDLFTGIEKQD